MCIYFNNLFCCNSIINSVSEKLPLTPLKQKVAIVALFILGCTAFYYFSCYRVKAQKIDLEDDSSTHSPHIKSSQDQERGKKWENRGISPKKKVKDLVNIFNVSSKKGVAKPSHLEGKAPQFVLDKPDRQEVVTGLDIPPGKAKAISIYQKNPERCGKIQKTIIFNDIKFIEPPVGHKKDIRSVVDLMLYVSGLKEIDLHNPLCAQVLIDCYKECNKEASEQLGEWLSKQKTFHASLLGECLAIFVNKSQQQIPFSLYSIELLIKIYKDNQWNQVKTAQDSLILPVNHESIVSAMEVLIRGNPNENRVIALAEWIMEQPEFDLQSFSRWVRIFQQKEQEKAAINLYYPLLGQMLIHFKKQWGTESLKDLDQDVENYLRKKLQPLSS